MKILLVNPPSKFIEKKLNVSVSMSSPPLGLAYLASQLENNGYEVKIAEMSNSTEDDLIREINTYNPDIVGTSCLTNFRAGAFKVMEIAKQVDKDIITIMGGPHATFMHKQILENYPVDFIVMGEGDFTIVELVHFFDSNNHVNRKEIKGISYKDFSGDIFTTEPRPIITDLDSLPFPAWHLLDLKLYYDAGYNYFNTIEGSKLDGKKITDYPVISIITTRGCCYNCQFCSTSQFFGHQWRARSPKNIVDEMEFLYDKYKIRLFNFVDDNFTKDTERIKELCREIKFRDLDIKWLCSSRADITDIDMLIRMKGSGCISMGMSPESGSQKILNNIHKCLTVEQIIKTYEMCKRVGLDNNMALMVGNPGETNETIDETMRLMDKIHPSMVGLNLTKVLPNTELYELAKKNGFIKDEDWLNPDFMSPVYTVENSMEQLLKWKQKLLMHFYMKHFGLGRATKYVLENPVDAINTTGHFFRRMFGKYQQIM